jgi:hypothetical protein
MSRTSSGKEVRTYESRLLVHDLPVNGNLVGNRSVRSELYDAR